MSAATQNPRFQELLKRAFGLRQGKGFDLEEVILPVAVLNDAAAPELALLRGERRYQATQTAGAVAAQLGFVRIECPVGSGLIIVVERILVLTATAGRILRVSQQKSVGVGVAAGDARPLDGRLDALNLGGADLRSGTRGASLSAGWNIAADATLFRELRVGAVLTPGWAFDVENVFANEAVTVGFEIRTRSADDGELRGGA